MIFNLPEIPKAKQYVDRMTPEQYAIDKCIKKESLTEIEKVTLKEALNFYREVFPKLKEINLSTIKPEEVVFLKGYLEKVFNIEAFVLNDVHFKILFRVTQVDDSFRDLGKVRDVKFLKYPTIELVKKKGVYNRANTDQRNVFYASFQQNVAIRETKPPIGSNIIISIWENISGKPFNSYPITNTSVENEGTKIATAAFNKTKEGNNILLWEITNQILGFLASEFVKECEIISENRFEYLYSAFFADKVLSPFNEEDPTPDIDFIIYPSVAWQHKHDNVAIIPDSVDKKLKLIKATEYLVEETFYNKELQKDEMPAKLKLVRDSYWIEEDYIIWGDD